jgi:drug/metabolite transporter (DMT)-like permease
MLVAAVTPSGAAWGSVGRTFGRGVAITGAPVPTTTPTRTRAFAPRDTALLLTLGGMWGLSFLFIEVALRGLTPLWIVAGRTLVGGAFLLVVLRLRHQPLPRSARLWGHLLVLGVVSNAVPWGAVAWAQQAIPSGLAALLMALVPTSTLLVSVLLGMERFSPTRALGLLLALGGVGLTVAADLDDPGRLIAIAVIVTATVLYALGAVYAKRFVSGTASALTIATGQVLSAGGVSLIGALLLDPRPTAAEALAPTVLGAVLALGTLGTGAAFLVFYVLIERVGATNTTLVTYLIPLVAVVAGAVVLGERLPPEALGGGALIGIGIWLAQRGTRPGPVEALEELPT